MLFLITSRRWGASQQPSLGGGVPGEEAGPTWLLPLGDASRPGAAHLTPVRASRVHGWHPRVGAGWTPAQQMAMTTSMCPGTGTGSASDH